MVIQLPPEFDKYDKASASVEAIDPQPNPFGGTCRSSVKVTLRSRGQRYCMVNFSNATPEGYEMSEAERDYYIKKADRFFSGFK